MCGGSGAGWGLTGKEGAPGCVVSLTPFSSPHGGLESRNKRQGEWHAQFLRSFPSPASLPPACGQDQALATSPRRPRWGSLTKAQAGQRAQHLVCVPWRRVPSMGWPVPILAPCPLRGTASTCPGPVDGQGPTWLRSCRPRAEPSAPSQTSRQRDVAMPEGNQTRGGLDGTECPRQGEALSGAFNPRWLPEETRQPARLQSRFAPHPAGAGAAARSASRAARWEPPAPHAARCHGRAACTRDVLQDRDGLQGKRGRDPPTKLQVEMPLSLTAPAPQKRRRGSNLAHHRGAGVLACTRTAP